MACKRNRIIALKKYIESLGAEVNIAKNKARGNNGRFIYKNNNSKIEVSKKLSEDEILSSLTHEFAHFVHYNYNKKLNSLDFIFDNLTDELEEELINITVQTIPKDYAQRLFNLKDKLKNQLSEYLKTIKGIYPDFKQTTPYKAIEKRIKFPANYLLKYDNVKLMNKIYSVKRLENDFSYMSECDIAYIRLKSAQRHIRNINSRINRLNKYYNNKSELFARCFDMYCNNSDKLKEFAPNVFKLLNNAISIKKVPELSEFYSIYNG